MTVDERELQDAVTVLRDGGGPLTTASGAAGLAGLLHAAAHYALAQEYQLDSRSVVLLVATEGAALHHGESASVALSECESREENSLRAS